MLSGKARVEAGGQDFGVIGERNIAVRGQPVVGLCAGKSATWSLTAETELRARGLRRARHGGSCRRA